MMKTNKTAKNKRNNEKGVTLIEICIAMLVVGLIMAPLLWVYNNERKSEEINTTLGYFNDINAAIASYVNTNDRYPLPARLTDNEGQDSYGKSFDADAGVGPGMNTMPGACPAALATDGICLITQDNDGNALANPQDHLLIGMVPFADLQIEEEKAYDIWGQRIIYVVTARQTQDSGSAFAGGTFSRSGVGRVKFTATNGWTGLQVTTPSLPPNSNELIDEPVNGITVGYTDFDALIYSTGPSGKGGYNSAGNVVGVCVEAANPEYEDENCDFTDNLFFIDTNSRFDPRPQGAGGTYNFTAASNDANGSRSLLAGPTFYDDLTFEILEVGAGIWNENFTEASTIVTSANRLGVGEQFPDTVVHVRGDVRAEDDPSTGLVQEGRVASTQIADLGGVNVMSPRLIGGQEADMNCYEKPLGNRVRPVTGIGFGRTYCAQAADSSGNGVLDQDLISGGDFPAFRFNGVINNQNCESLNSGGVTYRMKGIDAGGNVICAATP